MSKYIVRAFANGTKIDLAPSARNPQTALDRAMNSRIAQAADAFLVYERSTNSVVLTGMRK